MGCAVRAPSPRGDAEINMRPNKKIGNFAGGDQPIAANDSAARTAYVAGRVGETSDPFAVRGRTGQDEAARSRNQGRIWATSRRPPSAASRCCSSTIGLNDGRHERKTPIKLTS